MRATGERDLRDCLLDVYFKLRTLMFGFPDFSPGKHSETRPGHGCRDSRQSLVHHLKHIARQACLLPERFECRASVALALGIEALPAVETARQA